jgi:hypothetical protein
MASNHDQTEAIALILCPLCLAKSPNTPYVNVQREAKVDFLYKLIQTMGARKALLESKKTYVTRWCLHHPRGYAMVAKFGVELRCRYANGPNLYWRGTGALKSGSAKPTLERAKSMRNQGFDSGNNDGDGTDFQIDITGVWDQIHAYLERPPRW